MRTTQKKQALSVLLIPELISFLESESKRLHTSKTDLVTQALSLFKKFKLKQSIEEGFKQQTDSDVKLAMSDFDDYYNIIKTTHESETV